MKNQNTTLTTILLTAACLGFLPMAQALLPPPAPDGGYPGGNTAEGQAALFSLTTGGFNTAVGYLSLRSDTTGGFNTAIGAGTLLANNADSNTATGAGALLSNTTGRSNTANGTFALFSNTTGLANTAIGDHALANNTGNHNVALGYFAGSALTGGDSNIDIGNPGVAAESETIRIGQQGLQTATYIAGISGATVPTGVAVIVDSSGHLGATTSSARFKDEINPMDKASEAILALKPVTFRYKKELDPEGIPQFGLVAEQVENVSPDLVARDDQGRPYSVRYEAVNAMLLNEFLKEHKKVEEQQATIAELKSTVAEQRKDFEAVSAQQHKEIQALTASFKEQASQIQKVSAQVEAGQRVPQIVLNER
jgi:hypothetical protein